MTPSSIIMLEDWSPNAVYQATVTVASSNSDAQEAERFFRLVLLPRVRDAIIINNNNSLHNHSPLNQALKKAILYKPSAFCNGILIPLCHSPTSTVREAVVVGSFIEKDSIPPPHVDATLVELAGMDYSDTTSYFIKLLLEEKYHLPYHVIDAVAAHFMRFLDETTTMPVIWRQSLLAFVQRCNKKLRKEHRDNLKLLVKKQKHESVTPEIRSELHTTYARIDVVQIPITCSAHVIGSDIEDDRADINIEEYRGYI